MVENSFPKCPICRKEVLIPFSTSQMQTAKVFAHWVCTYCGFCIGTGDTRVVNPTDDIKIEILQTLKETVEKLREYYLTHKTFKELRV